MGNVVPPRCGKVDPFRFGNVPIPRNGRLVHFVLIAGSSLVGNVVFRAAARHSDGLYRCWLQPAVKNRTPGTKTNKQADFNLKKLECMRSISFVFDTVATCNWVKRKSGQRWNAEMSFRILMRLSGSLSGRLLAVPLATLN
jgi:hypothetical protein